MEQFLLPVWSFTSVTSITQFFLRFFFYLFPRLSENIPSSIQLLLNFENGEADVFGLARHVWVVRDVAEIWVRKSLVGVITRSLANEAFALVMA